MYIICMSYCFNIRNVINYRTRDKTYYTIKKMEGALQAVLHNGVCQF